MSDIPDTPVVNFNDVTFSYGVVPILQDVSFNVMADDLMYIVGPNGGGKTTLLKLILGLIKPTSGKILVFGDLPERARRRIGYTPQHIHYDPQFPVTAMEIVLMGTLGSKWGGRYSKSDKSTALEALDQIGLADLSDRLFPNLSGGQRQRVLIARSLASDPDLLLLDEPTANIDARTEDKLSEIINELNNRMTILMVSHDLGFASQTVTNVLCVNHKVVIHPTSDITDERILNIYGDDVRLIRHDLSC
ncbi:MAG: ABC transporter ATP-binding protein [Candidatus Electryoneaceae bacterium]|nr:ABC transporter ATP-binding protein [Candidatus Electryoneaceae bacterium]